MRGRKDLNTDLDRLVAATTMFVRQQTERATYGDDDDYDDAKEDSHTVVDQVLDTLEKNLDEDFVEQLDRGDYPRTASVYGCWPRLPSWYSGWPYWNYYGSNRGRVTRRYRRGVATGPGTTGRTHDMLDEILDDFRADFEDRLRNARREDRAVSEAELDDALQALRQDLSVVVRRSRRREDRKEEEEESRRRNRTSTTQ
jgi:hypothetical protein